MEEIEIDYLIKVLNEKDLMSANLQGNVIPSCYAGMPVLKSKKENEKEREKLEETDHNSFVTSEYFKLPQLQLQLFNTDQNYYYNTYNKIRYLDFRPIAELSQTTRDPKEKLKFSSNDGYYFLIMGSECPLVKSTLEDNGFIEIQSSVKDWTILWSSGHIKPKIYSNLTKYQRVNHFPRSVELTRKDLLYKNISKLQTIFPNHYFSFIPQSFILPNEHKFLEEEMEKDAEAIWIIKPVASSQGRGIFLTNKIQEIPSGMNMIASRYISNPYLINDYKFDLRIYVLLTSVLPLRIYIFEEGLVRFATEKYSVGQPFNSNKFIHLTNYAINKCNKNYIPNTDPDVDYHGSKWSLSAFKKFLIKNGIDQQTIFNKIDDIVIKAIISVEGLLRNALTSQANSTKSCFELFGFDILIDSYLNPWLIEVNLSPNLHCDTPIDLKIKGELIAEIFDIARIFPYDIREKEIVQVLSNKTLSKLEYIIKSNPHLGAYKEFKMNKEIKESIWETEEEFSRAKQFRRIFPSDKALKYRKYFDQEKEINFILGMLCCDNGANGKFKVLKQTLIPAKSKSLLPQKKGKIRSKI